MSPHTREPDPAVQAFLARRHGHFIDNELLHADHQEALRVYNPATGDVIAHVPDGTAADVDAAVRSARRAFEQGWGRSRPADRERLMWRLADLVEQHAEELAQIETLNQGKSIHFSRAVDVGGAVDWLRYAAGWATKIEGSTLDVSIQAAPGTRWRAMTLREPIGVVGAIVPWNFPLAMAVWKIAPALACGCTVVLKPSEETPLTALRFAELCREAGLPTGVVNIVNGRGTGVGAALAAHPGIDKITFTGSTPVGKLIGAAALHNMTRSTLELGGKSPAIVLADADLDRTAAGVAMGIFFNQGQVCTASSRLLVHRSIYEPLTQKVAEIARAMALGPGMDTTAQINPVVSARQQQRVMGYVRQGVAEGARVLCGGTDHEGPGFYVKPTVLADVTPAHTVVREEIFGPVLAAMPFDSVEEALALANDSPYGLAASIWSNDHAAITALSAGLKAGTIWVNAHNVVDANLPFGGFKQSGLGREHGRAMVEHYTETKSVLMAY